jgi:hypothetical protein
VAVRPNVLRGDDADEAGIILMGEAASLIKDSIAAQIHGVGMPPLKELTEFLYARDVRISV